MRKVLGVLFIVIASVLGTVTILGWTLRTTLLGSSAPVKDALRNGRVYDRTLTELVPVLLTDPSFSVSSFADLPLSASEVSGVVQRTILPSFLQANFEHALDIVYDLAYARTDLAHLDFTLQLQDLQRKFPPAFQDLLITKLKALPSCTTSQQQDYQKRSSLQGVFPPCLPKGTSASAVVAQTTVIQDLASAIPATYDVGDALRKLQGNPSPTTTVHKAQQYFALGRMVHTGLTVVVLLLLLGTGLLFLPRWRRVLQWAGSALVCAGLLAGGLVMFGWTKIPTSVNANTTLAQAAKAIFEPVGRTLLAQTYHRALLFCILAVALGIACIVGSFFLPNHPALKK